VLAAARVGINAVILPQRNEPDLEDIPKEIRDQMSFVFAERVDDVFAAALRDGSVPVKGSGQGPAPEPEAVSGEPDFEFEEEGPSDE
jgi:predicted ATP-dependent protease